MLSKLIMKHINDILLKRTKYGKNTIKLIEQVDDLRRNQLQDTKEGTEINITDAFDTKVMDFKLDKESTQETTTGKNKFDKVSVNWYRNNNGVFIDTTDTFPTRIRTTSFAIIGNKTYTISGIPSGITLLQVRQFNNNQTILANATLQNNTFTLDENCYYIHLLFGGENFTSETNTLMKNADIQIEEGSSATDYEKYTGGIPAPNPDYPHDISVVTGDVDVVISDGTNSVTKTIPLNDNEIVGIGNYKDELIVDRNGHCYLNKKIKKLILKGNEIGEAYVKVISRETTTYFEIRYYGFKSYTSNQIPEGFCNLLLPKTGNTLFSGGVEGFTFISSNNPRISLLNTRASTVEELKTWLSNNNLILYGIATSSQLIDLNYTVDMRLFKGTNNITNSETADMKITYVQDINTIINELINRTNE